MTVEKEKPFDLDLLNMPELPDVSEALLYDEESDKPEGKKYIVFLINNIEFAISADKVSEVVRFLPITTLPDVPEWLMGIANLRGDVVSIIDLNNLLDMPSKNSTKSKLIVLDAEKTNSHVAFKVDKIREIVVFSDDEINPNEKLELPYFDGEAIFKSKKTTLLNVENILASLIID